MRTIAFVAALNAAIFCLLSGNGQGMLQAGPDDGPAATGRIYYVDGSAASASDSNPGTESKPWKTLLRGQGQRTQTRRHCSHKGGSLSTKHRYHGQRRAGQTDHVRGRPRRTGNHQGLRDPRRQLDTGIERTRPQGTVSQRLSANLEDQAGREVFQRPRTPGRIQGQEQTGRDAVSCRRPLRSPENRAYHRLAMRRIDAGPAGTVGERSVQHA